LRGTLGGMPDVAGYFLRRRALFFHRRRDGRGDLRHPADGVADVPDRADRVLRRGSRGTTVYQPESPTASITHAANAMALVGALAPDESARRCFGPMRPLAHRLRQQTDSEYRLFGLVQQFHAPFGVLLEAARNAAKKIGADLGHLCPGGLAALEFRSLIGSARIATMANPKKYSDMFAPSFWAAPHRLSGIDKLDQESLPRREWIDRWISRYDKRCSERGWRATPAQARRISRSSGAVPERFPISPIQIWFRI